MADSRVGKRTFFLIVGIGLCAITVFGVLTWPRVPSRTLSGVVLVDNSDPKKQSPIGKVKVEISGSPEISSDSSGFFTAKLSASSLLMPVTFTLQHPGYLTYQGEVANDGRLYVFRMKPSATGEAGGAPTGIPISDIRIRYTERALTSVDTGSALKEFAVVNTANIPCNKQQPCSPDGKWKAAIGGASLDAGEDNEFREARVTCIAGPCPFTKIEHDNFSHGGRYISVMVRDWSDTVSYVIEAEVAHTALSDMVRTSYPIVFQQGMTFTLPASGEGPSIEAIVRGMEVVYPLGPLLKTTWTTCSMQNGADQARIYRCDLKPGYEFHPDNPFKE